MRSSTLYHKFTSALSWNAFLYIAHRILSTALVFVWYRAVPTAIFSTWSMVLSTIFLILLWLDFGFRKSIARYAPIFTAHRSFTTFTRTILTFQLTLLCLAAPFFYYFLPALTRLILRHDTALSPSLRLVASGLFISEALVEILRLLYHAHFLNKPFNILTTIARLLESTTAIAIILFSTLTAPMLLLTILTIKLLSSILIITIALLNLTTVYRTARHDIPPEHTSTPLRPLWYHFIRHSFMMWLSTSIKSLSERNFIIPTLTYTLGMEQANIFKLAQDGALFFERSLIKTIGTADTALLAHVEGEHKGKRVEDDAFKKLTRQIAGLCIPLFGVLVFLLLGGRLFFKTFDVFQIFLILTGTYLLEVLVSPYERVLEVKQRYLVLGIAYVPYVLGLLLVFYARAFIGLVSFVMVIQCVRLVSLSLMMGYGYYQYRLRFPLLFTVGWLGVACVSAVGVWGVVYGVLGLVR